MAASRLQVDDVRVLVNDGLHNAFTDLCRFRGQLYLTWRACPDGHMLFTSSRIKVLRSADEGATWTLVHEFGVPGRDVRDPHFLVFRDQLFVYSGTWLVRPGATRDINEHLGYAAVTADGTTWRSPVLLEGTYGHYIWRAATDGQLAYLVGRRKRHFAATDDTGDGVAITESALLVSDDGLIWRHRGLFLAEWGDEIAFQFAPGGSLLAIARGGQDRVAQVLRADAPYQQFTQVPLDRQVGGPLLARWGDHWLVGGRQHQPEGPRMALYELLGDTLQPLAEFPSGGDCSYPGFVALDAQRGLLSYYSSHQGSGKGLAPCHLYLARLRWVD
ncbi:MAG: hypothetical protein IT204_06900 [Fimbriimonadaceae bacterium]|nr:hypothetical protein [Fimbriimonadaceae bacterium]